MESIYIAFVVVLVILVAFGMYVYMSQNKEPPLPTNQINLISSGAAGGGLLPLSQPATESLTDKMIKEIINRYDAPAYAITKYADHIGGPPKADGATDVNNWWKGSIPDVVANNNRFINSSDTIYGDEGTTVRNFMYSFVAVRPMQLSVYTVADNAADIYINGVFQFKKKDYIDSDKADIITVQPGLSVIEVVLTNLGGAGGFMMAVYDEQNKLLFNTLSPGWKTKKI